MFIFNGIGFYFGKFVATILPEMFYHIVVLAYNEGWAYLYDIIQKVTGKEYRFGTKEMKLLYEEANKELIKLRKLE